MSQPCPRCSAACAAGNRFCQSCGYDLRLHTVRAQAAYHPGSYPTQPVYQRAAAPVYEKAPLGSRFSSAFLDGMIGLGLSLPTLVCFYFAMMKSRNYESYDPGGVFMLIVMGFFFYLLPLGYRLIKDGLGQGQSWGKKQSYLMVIDLGNNKPCGIGKSIARNLISFFLYLVPFIGPLVEIIIILASDSGRKLGDLAANTQVILTDQYTAIEQYP